LTVKIYITANQMQEKNRLAAYVWQGGMPGWKDDSRPDYVVAMGKAIRETTSPVFQGLSLKPPAP
jgi:hypothetical protein